MQEFPAITCRESTTGRRAALRSGPDVWEVIMVWWDYGPQNRDAFYRHWDERIPREHLDQALRYYERFPEEINRRLSWNERIADQLASRAE